MRYIILTVLALILAFGVIQLMKPAEQAQVPVEDGNKVLVAVADIKPGMFIIGGQHVNWTDIPEKDIKPNYLVKKNTVPANYEGAVARASFKIGEPIIKEKIVTPRDGGFLSAVLYPGMRAISVGVDVVSGNAGFIFPGDKVDLLLTHQIGSPDGKKSFATETFVEDVRVLAIDQTVMSSNNQTFVPKTVTMEVTPKQAEEVLVATQLGKISLVLRAIGSTTFNNVNSVKTYTKDSEVSKLIRDSSPYDGSVTVTRGKDSSTVNTGENTPSAP
jgi:pilus assembly protein CpaB